MNDRLSFIHFFNLTIADDIPESFTENLHKFSQKDTNARWVKKNDVNFFGYKNHVKQDGKSKLIVSYTITAANVHDFQATEELLNKEKNKGEEFYVDSAYSWKSQEYLIAGNQMINKVCEKGTRNHPLTEEQKTNNREKSKFRCRVEHIFGFMEMSMNEMYINNIGIKRATAIIGMMNLTYNMFREIQLCAI